MNGSRSESSAPAKARRTGNPSPSNPRGAVWTARTGRCLASGVGGVRGGGAVRSGTVTAGISHSLPAVTERHPAARATWSDTVPRHPQRRLCPVRRPDALESTRQVSLDGPFGDAEMAGDLLVRQSAGNQTEYLALAFGQGGLRR